LYPVSTWPDHDDEKYSLQNIYNIIFDSSALRRSNLSG
jgi:hypothetical protein